MASDARRARKHCVVVAADAVVCIARVHQIETTAPRGPGSSASFGATRGLAVVVAMNEVHSERIHSELVLVPSRLVPSRFPCFSPGAASPTGCFLERLKRTILQPLMRAHCARPETEARKDDDWRCRNIEMRSLKQ